jgi:uncharacterized membrane protein YadS
MAFKGRGADEQRRARLVAAEAATPVGRVQVPWFIGLFLLASVVRTVVPGVAAVAPTLTHLATVGLTVTLFLIGASLSGKMLRSVGWRPLVQGVVLWIFVSGVSLGIVMRMAGVG